MSNPSQGAVKTGEPWDLSFDPLYRVTRGFNLFLRGLFKDQEPGNYKWDDDLQQSEIVITDHSPVNLDVVEKRPAIVTIRGAAQWANLGLGQRLHVDFQTGRETKQDLLSCNMTFACLSREGVEAQRLAWIIFSYLPLFKPMIQRRIDGLHNIGNNMTMTGESGAGSIVQGSSAPEWKMVQVVCPLAIGYRASIEDTEKVWLRSIEPTMSSTAGTVITKFTVE